jgi:hypothetical protein
MTFHLQNSVPGRVCSYLNLYRQARARAGGLTNSMKCSGLLFFRE